MTDRDAAYWASNLKDTSKLSIIYTDLDNLKEINDNKGHTVADQVIEEVLQIGKGVAPDPATFERRYENGDEFILTYPEAGKDDAEQVAETFREKVFSEKPNGIEVTTSVGVASYPEDGNEFDEIVDLAEAAMRDSKDWGGDHVAVHGVGTPYKEVEFRLQGGLEAEQGDQVTVKTWRNESPPDLSKLRVGEAYNETQDRPISGGSSGTIMTSKEMKTPLMGVVTDINWGSNRDSFTLKIKEEDIEDLPDDKRSYRNF